MFQNKTNEICSNNIPEKSKNSVIIINQHRAKRLWPLISFLLLGLLMMTTLTALAEITLTETKFIANNSQAGDYYGNSVATDRGSIVVGAPFDDGEAINSGAVYLYETGTEYNQSLHVPDGWIETKLTSSDGEEWDRFGFSTAIQIHPVGDPPWPNNPDGSLDFIETVVVGAPGDTDHGSYSGAIYIYDEPDGMGGWNETKLTSSHGSADAWFGFSLAIAEDLIVVGSLQEAVYLFERNEAGDWIEQSDVIRPSDELENTMFGRTVATDGNLVVVGSPRESEFGAVYIYEPDSNGGWSETMLVPADGQERDYFGWSVAMNEGRIVVSAPGDIDNLEDSQGVYIYESDGNGGWEETKLETVDGDYPVSFGHAVALDGGRVAVGVPFESDSLGADAGAVYIFDELNEANGWEETTILASDGQVHEWFGFSVGITEERIVIGARNGGTGGATYMYEPTDSDGDQYIDDEDAFPFDPNEWRDSDNDGVGDNADIDDDNDGFSDVNDDFPLDPNEWQDNDHDNIGDNEDTDDDNDGVIDEEDAFPLDRTESRDSDNDGVGDNADSDDDNDGVLDKQDACPHTSLADDAPIQPREDYYFVHEKGMFIDGNGNDSGYTIADTNGCSSKQIIAAEGLGSKKEQSGITLEVLQRWAK